MERLNTYEPKLVGALLMALVWLSLVPVDAAAQQVDSARQYIERTEELLVWARGLVAETESEPARRVLQQAADLHQRSRELFERGRMVESLGVSRRVRDAVGHAVRVAREAMGLDERIRIRAERFRDQHGQLLERAHEANDVQALDFLERARQQAGRARDIYQQGDFKMAWKLLEQAEGLLQRAGRLLADSVGPERLDRALELTTSLINRTRERLGAEATPRQEQMLGEAEEALQRALKARDQGHSGQALQMATLAGNLARRAGRNGEGESDAEVFRRQADRFDARAALVGDRVEESASEPARQLLGRALNQRDRAADAHRAGDNDRALRQIRAAHDLLNQVENLIR